MTASPRSSVDLSSRPQFPDGLRVLLLDTASDASETARLLLDQRYQPVTAQDVQHAITLLNRQQGDAFDVVLADLSLVSCHNQPRLLTVGQDIWTAAKLVPIIVMGEKAGADDILQVINMGAADFLQKPLTQRCMRNIWQHTVRRLMGTATPCSSGSSSPRSPEQSPQVKEPAPGKALPGAAAAASSPTGKQQLRQLQVDDCMPSAAVLTGLELPPLLSSQLSFDPDTIFQDLECSPQPGVQEASLVDILCPSSKYCTSAGAPEPMGNPERMVGADKLLNGCISDYGGSGSTLPKACDCDASDISSAAGSGMAVPAERSSILSLRMQTSLRSWQSSGAHLSSRSTPGSPCTTSGTAGDTAGSVNQAACTAQPAAGIAAPGTLGSSVGCSVTPPTQMMAVNPAFKAWWEAHSIAKGMVWGMPMQVVATVPGVVISGPAPQSSYASTGRGRDGGVDASSKAGPATPATGVPVLSASAGAAGFMLPPPPPMCWPMAAGPPVPAGGMMTAVLPAAAGPLLPGAGWAVTGSAPWTFSGMMAGWHAGMPQLMPGTSSIPMQHMAGGTALAMAANWAGAPISAVPAAAGLQATGAALVAVTSGAAVSPKPCGLSLAAAPPAAAAAAAAGCSSALTANKHVRDAAAAAHHAGLAAELVNSSKSSGAACIADMCRSGSLDSGILEVDDFNLFTTSDDLAALPGMLLGLDGLGGLESLVC